MTASKEKVYLVGQIAYAYFLLDVINHEIYSNLDFMKVASELSRKQLRNDYKYLKTFLN